MKTEPAVLSWLLEKSNPGVRLRTLKELCGLEVSDETVVAARRLVVGSLPAARDRSWMELDGQALVHSLTALAEAGLSAADVPIEPVIDRLLARPFDVNCGDMMLLRALVMLGCAADARVQDRLMRLAEKQLPDGGWLCLQRLEKLRRIPKSCIKADMHGLLLAGELRRLGVPATWSEPLVSYFRRRRLFYRMDDPRRPVLDCRPGYRMTDVHIPLEYLRTGLQFLIKALAELGQRDTPEFQEAWRLLEGKRDPQGRVRLEGALAKSYLHKERVGQATKWGTLHTCLALGTDTTGGDLEPAIAGPSAVLCSQSLDFTPRRNEP